MLKIKLKDFNLLKTYLQTQILLESLDELEYDSTQQLKMKTKNYKLFLDKKIAPIINNTFKSNPKKFDDIVNSMKNFEDLKKHFNII